MTDQQCCGRGGARPGCGRKPGIKTRPVRLPEWLLESLVAQGDIRSAIVDACKQAYGITEPSDLTHGRYRD